MLLLDIFPLCWSLSQEVERTLYFANCTRRISVVVASSWLWDFLWEGPHVAWSCKVGSQVIENRLKHVRVSTVMFLK